MKDVFNLIMTNVLKFLAPQLSQKFKDIWLHVPTLALDMSVLFGFLEGVVAL